jgi:lysophospholipase L1-like esterase
MSRLRFREASLGVAAACAAIALGELGVRVNASLDRDFGRQVVALDPLSALIEPHGELGYRQKPGSRYQYGNGTVATANAMGFRGPVVALPKPPGTFRIVLLGESTTHGWGVSDDETIDAYMRRLLAQRYPTRKFEVVNLAFDGYDAYQQYERLRSDGLRLEPDLLIVNAGINDVRNARFPDLQDRDARTILYAEILRIQREAAQHGPSAWTRIKHYFYLARLPGMVRSRLGTAHVMETSLRVTPNPRAIDYFAVNLRRIAELARGRATPIVFSTPPSAIPTHYTREDTLARSYWIVDAETTQRYRDSLAQRMRQLAADRRRQGQSVIYVRHQLPPALFLDDCHPTAEGNQQLAVDFVSAAQSLLGQQQDDAAGNRAQHPESGKFP